MRHGSAVPLLVALFLLACEAGALPGPASAQSFGTLLKRADDSRKAGQYERAIADASDAIKLNGKNAQAYWVRGAAHAGRNDFDQAVADLTRAIQIDPKYAAAYSWRAAAWKAKGEDDRALYDAD